MRFFKNIYIYAAVVIVFAVALTGCANKSKNSDTLMVSIQPLKCLVERITCGDFPVEVFVPPGSSPETYSLTPAQMSSIERSSAIFVTGLIDFEVELITKMEGNASPGRFIQLHKGIELIEGDCSHNHSDNHAGHSHSIDPHIWTSPIQLRIIAGNIYETVRGMYPDSVKYLTAYNLLLEDIDECSDLISSKIDASGRDFFVIYHPALTYYSRDYGIEQLSLENEGKEPSAFHMAGVIDRARKSGIKYILYQEQYAKSTVEALAGDAGATPVSINPLAENILEELIKITNIISEK